MKIFSPTLFSSKATALLIAIGALVSTAEVRAQTTFGANVYQAGADAAFIFGDHINMALDPGDSGSPFLVTGSTTNGVTPTTFGGNFHFFATATGGPLSMGYMLSVRNDSLIAAGTTLPFTYSFTLAKDGNVTSNVDWSIWFRDTVNSPNSPVSSAFGTLTGASQTFTGSGSYNFASAASAGTEIKVDFKVTYSANNGGTVTETMQKLSSPMQGITLNSSAIPEPSTYAAFAGLGVLGFAAWRRRKSVSAKLVA